MSKISVLAYVCALVALGAISVCAEEKSLIPGKYVLVSGREKPEFLEYWKALEFCDEYIEKWTQAKEVILLMSVEGDKVTIQETKDGKGDPIVLTLGKDNALDITESCGRKVKASLEKSSNDNELIREMKWQDVDVRLRAVWQFFEKGARITATAYGKNGEKTTILEFTRSE